MRYGQGIPATISTMQRSVSVRVRGTVQGVFFRHSTKLQADALGVTGFVRNEPDGSVSLQAEGETQQVGVLLQWCAHGPDGATVTGVEVCDVPYSGYKSFQIRR